MTEETTEPRCYGHVFDPSHQGGPHNMSYGYRGWPAHTWTAGLVDGPGCRHCHQPFANGDRYTCVQGGTMHADCIADLDRQVTVVVS